MTITTWLRQPKRRAQLPALALLGVAIAWGLVRTVHVLYVHATMETPNHDLYTYFSVWFVLMHRSCADFALRESLYLPHTWLFFTPIFIFGWTAGRVIMFLLNVAAVFYIWRRLSHLAGLQGIQRWLLLAFFWCWSGPANVIGLGNLALVCLAAVLAAYPFASPTNGVFLMLSAMKQSLVFPLYFFLIFKRPKALIVPFIAFALSGLAALWWARLSFSEGLALPKYWADSVSAWTTVDHTCLRRLLAPFIKDQATVSILKWIIWFALFGITARFIKDPLVQLAALLLLALLPTYHYAYDMILAVPTLALFLKRCHLVWPTLITLSLAWDPFRQLGNLLPAGPMRETAFALQSPYLPAIILVFLGGLLYLELRSPRPAEAAQPLA